MGEKVRWSLLCRWASCPVIALLRRVYVRGGHALPAAPFVAEQALRWPLCGFVFIVIFNAFKLKYDDSPSPPKNAYVYIYIYIYAYMHICIYAYMHIYAFICLSGDLIDSLFLGWLPPPPP
jgi:hypothetical protein